MFIDSMRDLYQYRELLFIWIRREVRIRYKQSILGGLWAVLQPLSLMLIFSIIFTKFIQVPTGGFPYPIFSFCALMPWIFFSNSISFAVPSLLNNMNLVTKIYFPKEILPIAAVGAAFLDYLIASLVFFGMMILYHVPVHPSIAWLPLLILVQVLLALGISFLASALIVFFRDIRFIIPLGLQLWMYLSPVVYPVEVVPENLRPLYFLNPMAALINGYRKIILIGQPPDLQYIGLATLTSLVLILIGYAYFKRAEFIFAEII